MRKLAFVMTREHEAEDSRGPLLRKLFSGVYVANEGFTLQSANAILERGDADAVGFGKLFIANPDLPRRLQEGAALTAPIAEQFYSQGPEGYTDYPSLA